jgi:hypothetical protein
VPQHQQLNVPDVEAAPAPQQRAEQRPQRQVRNENAMPLILSGTRNNADDTDMAPSRLSA